MTLVEGSFDPQRCHDGQVENRWANICLYQPPWLGLLPRDALCYLKVIPAEKPSSDVALRPEA